MKIRKVKHKFEYWFRPPNSSKLPKHLYFFKKKEDLINFLNYNFYECINGTVDIHHETLNSSGTLKSFFVWYKKVHDKLYVIDLKKTLFRGRKYIFKKVKYEKQELNYFLWNERIFNLMSINDKSDSNYVNLLLAFDRRGFKDFDWGEYKYADGMTFDEIEWSYWSDRCNFERMKVIRDLIKLEKPHIFELYLKKKNL